LLSVRPTNECEATTALQKANLLHPQTYGACIVVVSIDSTFLLSKLSTFHLIRLFETWAVFSWLPYDGNHTAANRVGWVDRHEIRLSSDHLASRRTLIMLRFCPRLLLLPRPVLRRISIDLFGAFSYLRRRIGGTPEMANHRRSNRECFCNHNCLWLVVEALPSS